MRRAEIPDALMRARGADIDRMPLAVLAKSTRVDLVNRLTAAGEYRRRGRQHGAPADAARMYADLAGEVLTTTDQRRTEALVKAAGVGVTIGTGPPATAARSPALGRVAKAAGSPVIGMRLGANGRMHLIDGAVVASPANRLAKSAGAQTARASRAEAAARQLAAVGVFGPLAKAEEYERQADIVTDPAMRRGYLELAERARTGAR